MTATQTDREPSAQARPSLLQMRSHHLGKRIDLEACARLFVDRLLDTTKLQLSVRLGEGTVYLFSFGSVVFIEVDPPRAEVFLKEILPMVEEPGSLHVVDDFLLEIQSGGRQDVRFDRAILSEASPEKLEIAAMVLAQSTTLETFEETVEGLLLKTATVTEAMATGGRIPLDSKAMVRFIGVGLSTRRQIVSRLSILDAPEQIWEDSELDRLFHELRNNFELATRFRTLEYKLKLIHESVEVIVDLTNTRRTTILELTIIALIALEIVMAFTGLLH